MLKKVILLMIAGLLSMNAPSQEPLRSEVWWAGGTSSDVSDVANWVDENGSAAQALPGADATGIPYDIVRIGTSAGLTGGYEDFIHVTQPVLSTTYPSPDGNSYGGWWFVLNNNILTLEDGAYLVMNRENCNLRNGGKIKIKGRSDELKPSGPSLIVAGNFRIAANGSVTEAAADICQFIVCDSGYVQVDPALKENALAAFIIGTPDAPGTMPKGQLIIENNGRVEILKRDGTDMYLLFSNANPSVNKIIIRDKGELSLYGDPASMGRVGVDADFNFNGDVTSLQNMIDHGLITNDQGGVIEATGTNPTVIKATGVTGINDEPGTASLTYELMQNYPNPFNSSTEIEFLIPQDGRVTISVFNSLGQQLATLMDQDLISGKHQATFNAAELSPGIYFYKIQTKGFSQVKKMMLVK